MAAAEFTNTEMNVLSTAVACLTNNRTLCKVHPNRSRPEKTKYRILCADGRRRKVTQKDLLSLMQKITRLSGHKLDDDAIKTLREAGLQ